MSDPYGDDGEIPGYPEKEGAANGEDHSVNRHDDEDQEAEITRLEEQSGRLGSTKDLYALLNVSRTASDVEITASYRALCRIFHPDKHTDETRKAAAEGRFQAIQRAHEVLTDSHKRAVYDTLGDEGLRTNWQVTTRKQTPAELREEYERQAALKKAAATENMVKSRGDLSLSVDATQLVARLRAGPVKLQPGLHLANRLPSISFTQLFMKHQWDLPLTKDSSMTFQGQMLSRAGAGGGNVVAIYRQSITPKMQAEISTALLEPRMTSSKLVYAPDADSFMTASLSSRTVAIPPVLSLTYGRRIFANTTGFLSYRSGLYSLGSWGAYGQHPLLASPHRESSMMTVGLNSNSPRKERINWTIEGSLGEVFKGCTFAYGRRIIRQITVRCTAGMSNVAGLSSSVYAERQVSEHARLGLGLNFGYPGGVTLRLRFIRLGQKVTVPILLSREFSFSTISFAAAIPAMGSFVAERYYLGPKRRQKIAERLSNLRIEHADYIATRRKEADEALSLLREQTERKKAQEEGHGGLVILEAIYGKLESVDANKRPSSIRLGQDSESNESESALVEDVIDVTLALQALVHEGQLHLSAGYSKSGILGFYDPCLGERKRLWIKYAFGPDRSEHTVKVDDIAGLVAPLRSHRVM